MIEKQLRKYIIPNILATLGISCYIMVDTWFVALAAGADGITALNLMLPIYSLILAIGCMIGLGSATRYSIEKARGNTRADDYFSNSIIWTILIALPFVASGIFFAAPVLRLMGADDHILSMGLSYMQIVLCCAPFFMLNYSINAFVRNDNAPRLSMIATISSGIFNIIFDYIFMFPVGMGFAGAALATGLSPIVSIVICSTHFFSPKNQIRFTRTRPRLRRLVESCGLGLSGFVGEISGGITTMIFNLVLLSLAGNIAVAAYGITANAALVGRALLNGVAQGLQPLASQVHGAGETTHERRILKHSLEIAVGIAVVMLGLVFAFTGPLVAVFNNEGSAQLAAYAEPAIRLYFIGFLFAAVNVVLAGFYSAIGRGREGTVVAILRGVIAISAFALVLPQLWGLTGVWLAFPVAEVFTLLVILVLQRWWKKSPVR